MSGAPHDPSGAEQPGGPVEPPASERKPEPVAGFRNIAKPLRALFLALQAEGFTTVEALAIVGHAFVGLLAAHQQDRKDPT